jgi:hypothetical protein
MLTKQRHLLDKATEDAAHVLFNREDSDEPVYHSWSMRRDDWEEMGSPETITITIEPGDLLNQEN